jgi:hypothetical protein
MILCTTETCNRVAGIYGDIVQGNTETVDTLAVEDTLGTGLLPSGNSFESPIAVDGSYSVTDLGITTIIYEPGYLLKLN